MIVPHLDHEQRRTLGRILGHPMPHNLKWPQVVSLLRAISEDFVELQDRCRVTVHGRTETFRIPRHGDVPVDTVVKLRELLAISSS